MHLDPVLRCAAVNANIENPRGGRRLGDRIEAAAARVANAVRSLTRPVVDALQRDPQKRRDGQLRHAARAGRTAAVRTLITNGANVNAPSGKRGYTAVHEAVRSGNPATLQAVLDVAGVNVNQRTTTRNQPTPLLLAAALESRDAVRQLLEAGADPSLRTLDGVTPEAYAALIANTAGRGGPTRNEAARKDPTTVVGMLARAEASQERTALKP
ncbi:ankyrin repeat domain-containing protein [Aquincola sp. S2]|uniref:Ankyrin repeat domain-containing protein n=1 Tax=Pseudaquabacterium terrae TaxID=2732868 RepID=A0ABX2EGU0_9BURK|nr:ankyrin repeat domain-containing protein [Aquabacterium terrae]NRF67825.1 ankyrin repeat domain-containing protein [Aquabacterium terrae]